MSDGNAGEISDLTRDQIINIIRDNSKKGLISSEKKLLAELSEISDINGFYRKISEVPDFTDIKEISGGSGFYYYSAESVSDSYARLAVMLEEKDLLKLVLSTIRNDCRIYPRTTALEVFTEEPYCISEDELNNLLDIIKSDEQYADIAFCKTSIETIYLYSTRYMLSAQAEYLSEWNAVGQYESQ